MRKKRSIKSVLIIVPVILFLGFISWILISLFEGEEPKINVAPLPEFISEITKFSLTASDSKNGLRHLQISLNQGGKESLIFEKKFPIKGLFKRKGILLSFLETQ
jgi:hypothetical protein